MRLFRKKDDNIERYEADWPEEYGYEEPMPTLYMSEEEQIGEQTARARSGKLRILLMVLSGYVLFLIVGIAVTWTYPVSKPFEKPLQVSIQGWEQRDSYHVLNAEYNQIASIWQEDVHLNQKTVEAANNQTTLVPMQMGYNKVAEKLSSQIRYTQTLSVDPNYVIYTQQLLNIEKNMQQFNQLMNSALVNQDSKALTQAQDLDAQIQQDLSQLKENLDGIAKVLKISE